MAIATAKRPTARKLLKRPCRFVCGACGIRFWVKYEDESSCHCQPCHAAYLWRVNAPATGREPPDPPYIEPPKMPEPKECPCGKRNGRPCVLCEPINKNRCGCSSSSGAPMDDPGEHSSSWPAIVRGYEQDW